VARRAGTTVRNVRLYHERGLLPPPRREGRRAWYGPEHLRRLQLVISMLARGYPTAAIRELLEAWEDSKSVAEVLGFEEAVAEPRVTVDPRRLTVEEIRAMFPAAQAADFQRAVELEVFVPDGDAFVVPNPALFDAGAELAAHGVPLEVVLDTAAEIRAATDHLAEVFVALFNDHVWRPFVDAGMPPEDLATITQFLSRDRAVAVAVVGPALALAMQRRKGEAAGGEWPVKPDEGDS
jgi:DNA-binding transcriptional MerR regulator